MIDEWLIHTVNVTPYTGPGTFGETFGPAQTVPCFVDDSTKLVRNAKGDEVVSQTTVFADTSYESAFSEQSVVTVNGREARVISANCLDGDALGLPSHLEVSLT